MTKSKIFVIIYIIKGDRLVLNNKKIKRIAKRIADLEKEVNNENKIKMMSKIEELIEDCSMEELFKIDEIIMKNYLTN